MIKNNLLFKFGVNPQFSYHFNKKTLFYPTFRTPKEQKKQLKMLN